MKIQLLIAMDDNDYTEFLSQVLAEKYADTFAVSVCSSPDRFGSVTAGGRYDVVLLAPVFAAYAHPDAGKLAFLLWDGMETLGEETGPYTVVRKYQRISTLVSTVLEQYAKIAGQDGALQENRARITVVWSPIGGSGKTTVALACAAQRVSEGKSAVYLNLETFSGEPAYFPQMGKSISTILGRLDDNIKYLLQSIRQEDNGSGINYFCRVENYDDMAILTAEDVRMLAQGCAEGVDELVVDLPSIYDQRTLQMLDMADTVLLVVNASPVGLAKWSQFCTQNNVFEQIASKSILVSNQGAKVDASRLAGMIALPCVQSNDPIVVYKTLSAGYFRQ